MINLCIVYGGRSVERDISIITYKMLYKLIDFKKYKIISLYLDKENNTFINVNDKLKKAKIKFKQNNLYINNTLIDVVLPLVHGKGLEGGEISSVCELKGVCYTSSSVTTSCALHNKYITKAILKENKINTVNYIKVTKRKWENNETEVIKQITNSFKKVIIKPVNLGSSIGIKVANNKEEIIDAINNVFIYDDMLICEKYIECIEYNQAAYKKDDKIILSAVEEVINKNTFYTFEDKYESNLIERKIVDKKELIYKKISKLSKKIYEIFDDKGVIRIDYLVTSDKIYVNEVNVIPGNLSFNLFEQNKVFVNDLIDDLVRQAIISANNNDDLIRTIDTNINININKK